jgi:predicted DNA-binding transcriptional regulator AlpA
MASPEYFAIADLIGDRHKPGRYPGRSHMWVVRRMKNDGFPAPVKFGRLRFWKAAQVIAWERKQFAKAS